MGREYTLESDLKTLHAKSHANYKACALMNAWDSKTKPNLSHFKHSCLHCMIGKITANAYASHGRYSTHAPGDRVSADLSTNWPVSVNGYEHMLLIVDWHSNKFFTFLLRKKSESSQYLAWWLIYARTHLGHPVKNLHMDDG